MLKPTLLRKALTDAVPYLKQNPDSLHIFIDRGAIVSTLASSLSFEYQYTLNLIITDCADDADTLFVPILHWLRRHQPDIMAQHATHAEGLTFEADHLNNSLRDISINLRLTERVIVKEEQGALQVTHLDEPLDPDTTHRRYELFIKEEKVAQWQQ
ncbi:phage tail protein [Candidatus Fukatsuia symbiotica]|uniref:Phage tail protein n=1 Tax=Candidatus Fukatsuia symbiotica TaxID=1878942 RepID=A0A2U8I5I8_9GAMM|nr:phage tail protein [Candidatus Fukatsuia symbiotica]AWK13475.1 phage tail protein [Candidatus Fukatsuia symbiotica]MEA9444381.1 phage tail protein [Candidatus Fukatsuia symbiotica]